MDLMVKTKLAPSRAEARRLIDGKGVSIDDILVEKASDFLQISHFEKGYVIIKKGKKVFHKAIKI